MYSEFSLKSPKALASSISLAFSTISFPTRDCSLFFIRVKLSEVVQRIFSSSSGVPLLRAGCTTSAKLLKTPRSP
ncbi:Uncharacterised protein [Chlamydia trachomatis]|nr:Uncharacterised protein [Chlamydia trachomatis]